MDMTEFVGNSDYLKAADLKGKSVNLTIKGVNSADFTDDKGNTKTKALLEFKGKDKMAVLNITNTRALVAAFGAESDAWIGKNIVLSVRQTPLGDGLGVTPLPDDDFDDDVPF
jgi:hypothetical protein